MTWEEGALQEWFQHPAYSTALEGPGGQAQPTPFAGSPKARAWDENGANLGADMPSKPSFGFGTAIQEGSEHTNSDPEPGMPGRLCNILEPVHHSSCHTNSASVAPIPFTLWRLRVTSSGMNVQILVDTFCLLQR